MAASAESLKIIHFNDVYHIGERKSDPVGGVPRFVTATKAIVAACDDGGAPAPLILFSGDALSPSALSLVTRGAHMVDALNFIGVDASCLGNHDLDDGLDNFEKQAGASSFPWLATNVSYVPVSGAGAEGAGEAAAAAGSSAAGEDDGSFCALPQGMVRSLSARDGGPALDDGAPVEDTDAAVVPGCKRFAVVTRGDVTIGLIGLIEEDWLETLSHVDPHELSYESYVGAARRWSRFLREQRGCDVVIALTHMRLPNDLRLGSAAAEAGVDMVLGGHDHFYSTQEAAAGAATDATPDGELAKRSRETSGEGPSSEGGCLVAKSGTDFRALTEIDAVVTRGSGPAAPGSVASFRWRRVDVTMAVEQDKDAADLVTQLSQAMAGAAAQLLGSVHCDLDGRFSAVRTRETNLGNLIADLIRQKARADLAIVNGGTLRSDAVHKAGPFTMEDLLKIMPYPAEAPTVRISGRAIHEALEAAVGKYPALEGRFPQVSHLTFSFDPRNEPGSRIDPASVAVGPPGAAEPLDLERRYTVATTDYLSLGNDGFDALSPVSDRGKELGNEWVVDLTRAPLIPNIMRSHIEVVHAINSEQASFRDRTIERWRVRLLRLAGKAEVGSAATKGHKVYRGGSAFEAHRERLGAPSHARSRSDGEDADSSAAAASPMRSPSPLAGSDERVDQDMAILRPSGEGGPPPLARAGSAPQWSGRRLVPLEPESPSSSHGPLEPLVLIAPTVEGRIVNLALGAAGAASAGASADAGSTLAAEAGAEAKAGDGKTDA